MFITEEFLLNNPNCVFVFGDNLVRFGKAGAAKLRDLENTYGFITKKYPNKNNLSYYTVKEYRTVYKEEINRLRNYIINFPKKTFYISKLGAGLANKYKIYENIIEPNIKIDLGNLPNVVFLF